MKWMLAVALAGALGALWYWYRSRGSFDEARQGVQDVAAAAGERLAAGARDVRATASEAATRVGAQAERIDEAIRR